VTLKPAHRMAVYRDVGELWAEGEKDLRQAKPLDEPGRLFLGFLLGIFLLSGLVLDFLLFLAGPRLSEVGLSVRPFHYSLPLLAGFAAWAGAMAAVHWTWIPAGHGLLRRALSTMTPVVFRIAEAAGVSGDRVRNSYLGVNNVLAGREISGKPGGQILVMVPRCLQRSQCSQDLTESIQNCRRCGECSIASVVELLEGWGGLPRMVTGGSLAQELIGSEKPDVVVAIACERELTAGIRMSRRVPTIAVNNGRPEGPCVNTTVDMEKLKRALRLLP